MPRHSTTMAILLAATLAMFPAASAQSALTRDEIAAIVRKNLPPVLHENLPAVVENLLNVPLGTPLTESFDPARASARVFGRQPRSTAPDCLRTTTAAGEPDQGDCVISAGNPQGGGAFIGLAYGKNIGIGNIRFRKRGPVQALDPRTLKSVQTSNADVYQAARSFLTDNFGLSAAELPPLPPAGVPVPVRSLTMGFDPKAGVAPVVMQKTVQLLRAFALPKPIAGPSGAVLSHVRGPGRAMVALDDSGVVGALVSGWHDLRRDPSLTAINAKTPSALIEEIADDLFAEAEGPIAEMTFQIVVGSDWRGSHGVLVPAVKVFVSAVPQDLSEEAQHQLAGTSTAGVIREYWLVNRSDAQLQ